MYSSPGTTSPEKATFFISAGTSRVVVASGRTVPASDLRISEGHRIDHHVDTPAEKIRSVRACYRDTARGAVLHRWRH